MALEHDLQDAIKKNLSAEVGEVLRKRLEQAEKDARDLVTTKADLADAKARLRQEETLDSQRAEIKGEEAKLAAKEAAIIEREREIRHKEEMAALRLTIADQRANDLKEITRTVFRSPTFQRTVNVNESVPLTNPNNPGYQTGSAMASKQTTETSSIVDS